VIPRDDEALLTPGEVAAMFRVSKGRVAMWAKAGKLSFLVTPGGHRRYSAAQVADLYAQAQDEEGR
jgi:excisionase family DNA binding protein